MIQELYNNLYLYLIKLINKLIGTKFLVWLINAIKSKVNIKKYHYIKFYTLSNGFLQTLTGCNMKMR